MLREATLYAASLSCRRWNEGEPGAYQLRRFISSRSARQLGYREPPIPQHPCNNMNIHVNMLCNAKKIQMLLNSDKISKNRYQTD